MTTNTKQRELAETKPKPPAKRLGESLARLEKLAKSETVTAALTAKAGAVALSDQLKLADVIGEMRKILTRDVMEKFSTLQGSELGFMTDRASQGKRYSHDELRDPIIHALLRRFSVVDNEFNIIAGRFYAAKNGCRRLCEEWPGITDIRLKPGVPQMLTGGACIPMYLRYKSHGVECEERWEQTETEDTRIVVRVNSGMGADAIIGKAQRKVYARFLEILSGMTIADPPDSPLEGRVVKESKTKTLEELTPSPRWKSFKSQLDSCTTAEQLDSVQEMFTADADEEFKSIVIEACDTKRQQWLKQDAKENE